MLSLGPADARPPLVARWLACAEHELPTTDDWLSAAELSRAVSLRFTKRRHDYLLRRWVGKHAVAAAGGLPTDPVSLASIEVANRTDGAPYVLLDGAPLGFDVSLTGRAGWAVCVVGPDLSPVGCDLEVVEPRSPAFVTDYLTTAEQAFVASVEGATQGAATNLVWSAKESALKVLRAGLRRDTRSVEVTLPGHDDPRTDQAAGWAPLEVRTAEGGLLPGWWRGDGSFLLTVVSARPLPPPEPLAGPSDLRSAAPAHTWLRRPLAD